MKVVFNNNIKSLNKPNFTGFERKKDEYGEKYYEWSYPYDSNRYDCYLEVYPVAPDKNGNYDTNSFDIKYRNILDGKDSIKLEPGKNKIDLDYIFGRYGNAPFAYHYSLVPKSNPGAIPIYKVDAGDLVDVRTSDRGDKIFNIVVPHGDGSSSAGAAILIGADNYDVRYKYDKNGNIVPNPNAERDLNVFKNFANHVGGSLAGVHKALNDGRLDLYNRIFLLPHASGDRTSSAGYWLESGFQFSSIANNVDTFSKFQKDLFIKGKTLVADSALTSEGMSGIHIQSILKHGADDVFFDWFKCSSLKDMSAKIGVFGKKSEHIRHKLVNPPMVPVQNKNGNITWENNENYKKDELTYVQVYNNDTVSEEQIKDPNLLIEKYAKPNGSNPLLYGTHNDTVIAYAFPVKFDTYKANIDNLNELNKRLVKNGKPFIPLDSYMGTRIVTKFEGFDFENKIDGGFYTWDSNADIAKFDYVDSNEDVEDAMNMSPLERDKYYAYKAQKRCEVLDYAVSSLKYWTGKTNQLLNLYVAQTLKGIDTKDSSKANALIQKNIADNKLPKKINDCVNDSVVNHVIENEYLLRDANPGYSYNETILDGIMSYPLESTEFGKDILALFSTPYITNRATKAKYIGKSRFELLKDNNPHLTEQYKDVYNLTTHVYTNQMFNFAKEIINEVNKKLPDDLKLDNGKEPSDYGKYVLPIITQEIAKYAVVKGLFPDVETSINKDMGGVSYDYDAMRKKSLNGLNIKYSSQEREAEELIIKLRNGINQISDKDKKALVNSIYRMIEGTNLKSFQMAEMIVDRTKSGIDWRIDAAKDFSNMDALRNGADSFEDNWERVIYVLKSLADGVRSQNPNSYIVAEVTDEVDLHRKGDGAHSDRFVWKKYYDNGNFVYRNDIVRKLLRESGIDSVANYSNYFTNIAAIFGKKGDDGEDWGTNQEDRMYNIFRRGTDDSAEDFLYSGPYDSILKSYTFVDNHDKPRINHVLSLDMELFYANLNNSYTSKEQENRRRAFVVLNPEIEASDYNVKNFDYSSVSSMAVARGEALHAAFYKAIEVLKNTKDAECKAVIDSSKKDALFMGLKNVIAEFAAGKYKGMNYEADNFGAEEVHKVIQLVLDEYEKSVYSKRYPIDKKLKDKLFNETFKVAMDPVLNNSLGMDKFLVNSPGIPTIYAGDDLGSTGYDRKTKNVFVKSRSAVHHDWVDKFKFIKERKEQKDAIYMLRSRPALHALNDGAPFLLKQQYSKDGRKLTGMLRYAPDGNAVISLFNTSGITHSFDKYTDPFNHGLELANNRIDLSQAGDFLGLHGGLKPGMEFINAYDPGDKYYVYNKGGDDNYYLAKNEDCTSSIVLTDNTLTLYSASDYLKQKDDDFVARVKAAEQQKKDLKEGVSFCGTFINKQYVVSPAKYSKLEDLKLGENLEIIAK